MNSLLIIMLFHDLLILKHITYKYIQNISQHNAVRSAVWITETMNKLGKCREKKEMWSEKDPNKCSCLHEHHRSMC